MGRVLNGFAIAVAVWWGYGMYTKDRKDYSIPWWTGTEYMQVCQAFGGRKCYRLAVRSDGGEVTRVDFPNGGYIVPSDGGCAEAADIHDYDQFCRVWDGDDVWEIIPLD